MFPTGVKDVPGRAGGSSRRRSASRSRPARPSYGWPENGPAPVAWPPMALVEDVGLAPLPGDLERVEVRLADAVRAEDRFLGDVAAHLLAAGGKRLRPTLTLCAAYAAVGADDRGRRRDHRRRRGRARAPRVALPRRRDRRGRDPPGRAERQRPLVEHRRDPRRRLLARPGVFARRVARRGRRRVARRHDR